MTPRRRWVGAITILAVAVGLASCSSSSSAARARTRRTTSSSTTPSASPPSAAPGVPNAAPCGAAAAPPPRYDSVLVVAFENRSWDEVGPGFGPGMPYLHGLGAQCSWFSQWVETDQHDKSLAQYIGQITGARQPGTVADCKPSATCSTTADNIFRQLRTTGRRGVNYVEGAATACSADGNAAKHIPALYLWDPSDREHCADEVRPLSELDPNRLPAFAFVTPTMCNDGHDCDDATVDAWARAHLQPILDSDAYRRGKVAVFVWYDESTPVPNLWITPSAAPGARPASGSAAATLAAWQSMLGLPCLADACRAPDLRAAAHA